MSAPKKRRASKAGGTPAPQLEVDYTRLAAEILRQQTEPNAMRQPVPTSTSTVSVAQPAGSCPIDRVPPIDQVQDTATTVSGLLQQAQNHTIPPGPNNTIPNPATTGLGISSVLDRVFGGESSQACDETNLPIRLTDGIPLGATVAQRWKQKIWDEEFFDFACLLPSYSEEPLSIEISPGVVRLQQQPKGKIQLSMHQWTSGFLIFMAVYIEKKPEEAQHLLKYAASIRDIHQHYGDNAWRSYDQSFRKLRQSHLIPWQRPVDELWERARHAKPANIPGHSAHQQGRGNKGQKRSNQPFRKKFCFAFNNGDTCTQNPCKYRHICQNCESAHGRHQWPQGKKGQQGQPRKPRTTTNPTNASR